MFVKEIKEEEFGFEQVFSSHFDVGLPSLQFSQTPDSKDILYLVTYPLI